MAVRFLDYAPVIVEPGSEGVGASRDGSAWYGSGKRCVFECEEVALGKKLKARSESALPGNPCALHGGHPALWVVACATHA